MVKQIFSAIVLVLVGTVLLSSCTAFKSLNFSSNKQVAAVIVPPAPAKFINTISVTPEIAVDNTEVIAGPNESVNAGVSNWAETNVVSTQAKNLVEVNIATPADKIELASPVQLKYAVLLNMDVESLPNRTLLETVDNWYGVRYRTGGNGKNGIDCSGFTVAVYAAAYGINLPRVSKEQYRISRKISTTELQEGDLLFFNTTGSGVSHVGVYLGNNKFIHSTVSKGVMVNGLFENYYVKRFLGAGRIDEKQIVTSN